MGVDRDDSANKLELTAVTERDSGLNARNCLNNLEVRFNERSEYFTFTKVGDEAGFNQWFLRMPKPEKAEIHVWLKDFDQDLIHVCHPIDMWRAIEENQIQRVPAFSGYAVDGECHRCKREVPKDVQDRVWWFTHSAQKTVRDL